MSDSSKDAVIKRTPDPSSVPSGDNQPSGMKSDSQLHKMAVDEDNGKV